MTGKFVTEGDVQARRSLRVDGQRRHAGVGQRGDQCALDAREVQCAARLAADDHADRELRAVEPPRHRVHVMAEQLARKIREQAPREARAGTGYARPHRGSPR
ncbi:MAG: hypothetical protein M5U32_10540 [Myxococcota bacterium]|nr:hypothetical protein [Myxococcota bacterium]